VVVSVKSRHVWSEYLCVGDVCDDVSDMTAELRQHTTLQHIQSQLEHTHTHTRTHTRARARSHIHIHGESTQSRIPTMLAGARSSDKSEHGRHTIEKQVRTRRDKTRCAAETVTVGCQSIADA
jgi:hypothetical protein